MDCAMRLIEAEALLTFTLRKVKRLRRTLLSAEEDEVNAAVEYAQSILQQAEAQRAKE